MDKDRMRKHLSRFGWTAWVLIGGALMAAMPDKATTIVLVFGFGMVATA